MKHSYMQLEKFLKKQGDHRYEMLLFLSFELNRAIQYRKANDFLTQYSGVEGCLEFLEKHSSLCKICCSIENEDIIGIDIQL